MVFPTRLMRFSRAAMTYRPLRFLVVGGSNTLAGYALYAVLVFAGMPFWAANFCCLVFGVSLNFYLQSRYVFHDYDWRRFARFFGGWFCIYLVQIFLIWMLMREAAITPLIAGLIVLPGATIASYFVQKLLVFRTDRSKP